MFKVALNLILMIVGLLLAKTVITAGIAFAGLLGLAFALLISAPLFIGAFKLRSFLIEA